MSKKINPQALEAFLVEPDTINWNQLPQEIVWDYWNNKHQGIPTGIGRHGEIGWFVLETTGQGASMVRQEKGQSLAKKATGLDAKKFLEQFVTAMYQADSKVMVRVRYRDPNTHVLVFAEIGAVVGIGNGNDDCITIHVEGNDLVKETK